VRKFKYHWEKDLIPPPLSSENSSKEWMDVVKNRIMNKKRSVFNRIAPLVGSISVIVLAVGIFVAKNDKIMGLIPYWSAVIGFYATPTTYEPVKYPPRNKVFENQEQLSKEEQKKADFIQKMAYAYQNIKTLKGKAEININALVSTVEFQIREGKNPASYEVVTQPDGTRNEYKNDNQYMLEQTIGKEERVTKVGPRNPEMEPRRSFVSTIDGNPSYYFPNDPAWTKNASDIVAPLRNLGWMVVDLNLWSILGEESFLGRKVKVVEGKLPSYYAQKMQAVTYKVWVDDETSMVLKKQTYDSNGNVDEGIEVTSIEVNPKLENSIFEIPDEKLKEIDQTGKQSMTTSPHMMAGDFPVPDSISAKWEEAKNNRHQTTTIPFNGDWYIIPKEGFLVNYIKVNGNIGIIVMSPTIKGLVPAVAKNYKLNDMKIEYEK
jgi:hypothetical protein